MSAIIAIEKDVKQLKTELNDKLDTLAHAVQNVATSTDNAKLDQIIAGLAKLEHSHETTIVNQNNLEVTVGKVAARVGDLELKEEKRTTRENARKEAKQDHKEQLKLDIESKRETRRTMWHVVSIAVAVVGVALVYTELVANGTIRGF